MNPDSPDAKPALVWLIDSDDPIHAYHARVSEDYVYILQTPQGDKDGTIRRYIPWHRIEEIVRGETVEVFESNAA